MSSFKHNNEIMVTLNCLKTNLVACQVHCVEFYNNPGLVSLNLRRLPWGEGLGESWSTLRLTQILASDLHATVERMENLANVEFFTM